MVTRVIVDTEATLRAKRALRDRLQQLLATRPGSLADLLGVERELARVQGEIDSSEPNLASTRTRVAMSAVTIEYASTARGGWRHVRAVASRLRGLHCRRRGKYGDPRNGCAKWRYAAKATPLR